MLMILSQDMFGDLMTLVNNVLRIEIEKEGILIDGQQQSSPLPSLPRKCAGPYSNQASL
jgi:hypothetical protein